MNINNLISDVQTALNLEDMLGSLFSDEESEELGLDCSCTDVAILKAFLKKKYQVIDFVSSYKIVEDGEYYYSGGFTFNNCKYTFGFFPAGGTFWASE